MTSTTTEQALESCIEKALTGICREELNDGTASQPILPYGAGYTMGERGDFNARYALDEVKFWNFLETTQAEELAKLQRQPDWKLKILERYDRMIKKYGILRLLKKGLEVDDARFTLFYQYPNNNTSATARSNFEKNIFSITRQVHYSLANPGQSIDMAAFINGIPFATMELKNPWTGQTAKVHAQHQYKYDRDIRQPLLQFGRCLVHFAVDPDEIYMTTRLNGENTYFLPFNKGNNHGKGNPPHPEGRGHRTYYLWEEILKPKSISNIIQHFVRFDGKDSDALSSRTLYFPRYHQLRVVRRLTEDILQNGVGKTYLIQHSAGSGKSNSITWLAYHLIEIVPERTDIAGARATDMPLFDSVIVVTDRRLLDKQLRDNIRSFSEVKQIVAHAKTSRELKENMESGKRIIITTIQKFPFIADGIVNQGDKRFAVIIDEAHSSQSGSAADNMNRAMSGQADEDLIDVQDKILEVMKRRKMLDNASYFAFTATPKEATFEKFGVRQADGSFREFDLYSMKQAIEEGFILDVLANYTTYRSYYEIEKSIEDNPFFNTAKAQKKLRAFVERNPRTIQVKAEIMLDHFLNKVVRTRKLKGKAKGMVLTQDIESAIRYYHVLNRLLEEIGNPFKILIAFSGSKKMDGNEYTEERLNGFPEKETREKFDTDEYRLLVVANKYLTGFDQPKLTTMYVDKKLQDVVAVQALSRLNRSADKLGKKTEDLFVLDFFNSTEDIKKSFDPFYTSTTLSEATDVNVLHELKAHLDEAEVYDQNEVEDFIAKYFSNVDAQLLSPIIDMAADRFNHGLGWDDQQKADFKIKVKQFVKVYSRMASLIPFEIPAWEKLFWFLKFLIPKLVLRDASLDEMDELLNSVDLSTYGLQRIKLNESILLDEAQSELNPQNPNMRGAYGSSDEEDPLDQIINSFNELHFLGWNTTPEDQRVKFVNLAQRIREHTDFQEKYLTSEDPQKQDLAFDKIFDDITLKNRKSDMDFYRLISHDEAFRASVKDTLKRILFERK